MKDIHVYHFICKANSLITYMYNGNISGKVTFTGICNKRTYTSILEIYRLLSVHRWILLPCFIGQEGLCVNEKRKIVSSGISRMVNICRTGEITGLLRSKVYCLALLLPPRNSIQAGRGCQFSAVSRSWISCIYYNCRNTDAQILPCICKPFLLCICRKSDVPNRMLM